MRGAGARGLMETTMLTVRDDPLVRHDLAKACHIVRRSRYVHGIWYAETYPDVALTGMDPLEHYLTIGAALGRNPGRDFDTLFYLEQHPEVLARGENPLLHYIREKGAEKGWPTQPPDPERDAPKRVRAVRDKLLMLGFTEEALKDLREMARSDPAARGRALAARDLAVWHLRQRGPEEAAQALGWLEAARAAAPDLEMRCQIAISELLAHHLAGDPEAGRAAYARLAEAGEVTPDTLLARANFETTAEDRLPWIRAMLAGYGLPGVDLLPEGPTPYDRLTAPAPPPVTDGPLVTVLLAAYEAAAMIPTALRSLQAQSWRNLEILVIDDRSPDDTCAVVEAFAAADPRIRLIRMEQNGGAYVARNRGLDEARGDFITLHDADDWSHPLKIETQMRHMAQTPGTMGCTSEQVRLQEDLSCVKVRGNGTLTVFNTSSFLWRRDPVQGALGYWDTVRYGADNEFVRRVRTVFGPASIQRLPTGPLSFQRESEASVTVSPVTGVDGYYYGVRKEYRDAQLYHHAARTRGAAEGALRYSGDPAERPFPVPAMMRPDRAARLKARPPFDLVIEGDFRSPGPVMEALAAQLAERAAQGMRIGLLEANAYAPEAAGDGLSICPELRAVIDGERIELLVYGDEVCARARHRLPGAGPGGRYRPVIHEAEAEP
ncbi:glycosyltransferase family 2 protein [Jannaschia seohaensis]|uniref:Glycosyl transferase family 2 n=1 Tax=Jannaschia seohaensis TaxID=475081 RepID=A0A2Y9B2I6_9RHOB|nr:glycosyltransferase family A protein [Jannaschia seohaensis]PWJ12936.1 glycosyl transferase family 2 [Jannaschia seohaensis]SSA50744.1 Glycosyl transferase family 2 [Jannaschia seohaensis]